MTAREVIKILKNNYPKTCRMVNGRYQGGFDDTESDFGQALTMAISALEEIQQYREIGTVEECRADREKQSPKKPIWKQDLGIVHKDYADGHGETVEEKWADLVCPDCGWFVGEQYIPRRHNQSKSNYCSRCGQKINWSESLEGMEDE